MKYLNVLVTGLRGGHHPALSNQLTTFEVQKGRPHLKMLCCDYYTYEKRADQSGGSPHCRCCENSSRINVIRPSESIHHILTQCPAYSEIRNRIILEFASLCSRSGIEFEHILEDEKLLCQFFLDPTSLNLPVRVSMSDPNLGSYYRKSRDLCFSIHNTRMKILQERKETTQE